MVKRHNKEVGVLGAVGKSVWQISEVGKQNGRLHVKCLRCRKWCKSVYDFGTPIRGPLPHEYTNFNAVYVRGIGWGWIPLSCTECRNVVELTVPKAFSYRVVTEMHSATKAVLQTLPQPIFEEVWNHVGWEPLIE